jgi:hypothetical protein
MAGVAAMQPEPLSSAPREPAGNPFRTPSLSPEFTRLLDAAPETRELETLVPFLQNIIDGCQSFDTIMDAILEQADHVFPAVSVDADHPLYNLFDSQKIRYISKEPALLWHGLSEICLETVDSRPALRRLLQHTTDTTRIFVIVGASGIGQSRIEPYNVHTQYAFHVCVKVSAHVSLCLWSALVGVIRENSNCV